MRKLKQNEKMKICFKNKNYDYLCTYNIIKTKDAPCIEHPAIQATSFVSIVIHLTCTIMML